MRQGRTGEFITAVQGALLLSHATVRESSVQRSKWWLSLINVPLETEIFSPGENKESVSNARHMQLLKFIRSFELFAEYRLLNKSCCRACLYITYACIMQ